MAYASLFEYTSSIVSLVAEASELVGQMPVFEGLDPNLVLRRENQIRTIHSSLLIENNTLLLDQVTAVLNGTHVLAPPKDVCEVRNAYEAYEAVARFSPYSLDDLLRAHRLLMKGLVKHPGCLRNQGVGTFAGDEAVHAALPERMVPKLMGDLFDWLRALDDHPLVRGSVFHYEFEFIYPFVDGNGRTGRLWHSLLLRNWRPIFVWLPVETLIHQNQQAYYNAIVAFTNAGSSTVFVEFMLRVIHDALADALERQRSSSRDEQIRDRYERQVSERAMRVLRLLVDDPALTYASLAAKLGVSSATARREVSSLVERGIICRVGARKNGRWEVLGD